MCDSHQPLNGADSGWPLGLAGDGLTDDTAALQTLIDADPAAVPVWRTRVANGGWDSPEVPRSARAGDRGGE